MAKPKRIYPRRPKSDRDYDSPQYKKWRAYVRKRDKSTCRMCGSKSRIKCHHIRTWHSTPSLRYRVNNGICLCHFCHVKITGHEEAYQAMFTRLVGVYTSPLSSSGTDESEDEVEHE